MMGHGKKGVIMQVTRKEFLKFGGAAALMVGAGAALTACGKPSGGSNEDGHVVGASDINWAKETEILIIGTGIAGLAAGVAPALAGKKVTFVEKLSTFGGESIISCGFMFFYGSKYQIENGLTVTLDEFWEQVKERYQSSELYPESWWADWTKRRFFATTAFGDAITQEFGARWQKPPSAEVVGSLAASVLLPENGISVPLSVLEPTKAGLESKGAEFLFDHKATALIMDAEGAVIGLRCVDQLSGENVDIKAEKVCICTGGFSCNQELIARYLPNFSGIGNLTVSSTGDGQLMGFAAGAKMYGMENYAYLMGDIPQATTWGYFAPLLLVLPDGKRFISEGQSHDSGERADANGFGEWWVIFNNEAFEVDEIADSVKKNIAARQDRYVQADTIEELAVKMKIDPATLSATLAHRNEMAAAGEDTEFKNTRHFVVLNGPFHALRLMTRRYKTYGGFLTTVDCEVLDERDNPIPNLYAAGSTVPWSTSDLSPNAGNGYMAGESMLAALG
jgi:fumarate reductase flavoprotein subunit